MSTGRICLVGAGNMGGAMLGGWLEAGYDPDLVTVVDPSPPPAFVKLILDHKITHVESAKDAVRPDLILAAVKPQIISTVLEGLTHLLDDENALLSVAAGTTIENLAAPFKAAGTSPRIIRAMPNTPAQVGRGITVCVGNDGVSNTQIELVTSLLRSIGLVEWVEDEDLIDAVTGVSGSGPAYVFHMAEALAKAGEKAGLPPELAASLAQATVSGAGELMRQSDLSPSTLRENVTSPNGTTAAALEVLMGAGGLSELMEKAVAAATNRSRELAG